MRVIYLNLDADNYLLSVSKTNTGGPSVKSLDGFDFSGHRIRAHRWDGEKLVLDETRLAELDAEATAKAEELAALLAAPTTDERLAAVEMALLEMMGVTVDG